MNKIFLIAAMLLSATALFAQTPTDMQFVPGGSICPTAGYSYNSWKKYWEGDTLRENGNVGTVSHQSINAGINVGICDRVNAILMMPYMFSHASEGTLNGQHGLSDISLNVKAKYAELKMGPGKLKLGGDAGISTPISHYLVDFAPLNLGSGTTNINYRQFVAYQLDKGFFVEGQANYTYRSDIDNIHREMYFDQSAAYYSNEVQVPNIFDWTAELGFSNKKMLAELEYNSYKCVDGPDIRTWDPGFPTNKVELSTITARYDYYFSKPNGLGITAIAGYTLSGRNAGQAVFASIGVDYLIPVWGKSKTGE